MIVDMLNNKKLNPIVTELFIRGRKLDVFSCFYYTLFYYENSKQTRTSTNCILPFIRYWLSRLYKFL